MTDPTHDEIDRLAARVAESFERNSLTLAVAESCTGGLLSAQLTELPGSSGFFLGSVVPYHDVGKTDLLGVDPDVIKTHGAVSPEVACALARATRKRFRAAVGLAITGIAGPGGARPGKPVGLTYIAVDRGDAEPRAKRFVWDGDRSGNRRSSVRAALELLEQVAAGTQSEA